MLLTLLPCQSCVRQALERADQLTPLKRELVLRLRPWPSRLATLLGLAALREGVLLRPRTSSALPSAGSSGASPSSVVPYTASPLGVSL